MVINGKHGGQECKKPGHWRRLDWSVSYFESVFHSKFSTTAPEL